MEIKKVVMPGFAKPTVGGVQAPAVATPVVKPAPVVAPAPVVKPVAAAPIVSAPVTPSVTSIPKTERLADVTNAVEQIKASAANNEADDIEENEDGSEEEKKGKKKEKKEFTGPRKVVVYGRELFVEENHKVSLEDIRKRIVDEYEFPEFSKERTQMSLDEKTGIVVPVISFQKKG